jgi:hypothetical protein
LTVRRALTGCLTAAVLAGGTVALVTAPDAAADPVPTIGGITWGQDTITTSGTAMAGQSVSLHIIDPRPGPGCWVVDLAGHSQVYPGIYEPQLNTIAIKLALTGGSNADGTWTGTFYLPSTANGIWTATDIVDCQPLGQHYSPLSPPTFTVSGTHQPRLTWGVHPSPIPALNPYAVLKGRVYDASSQLGIAGVTVGWASAPNCTQSAAAGSAPIRFAMTVRTDANGYYAFPAMKFVWPRLECTGILGDHPTNSDGYSAFVYFRQFRATFRPSVVAAPATSTVRAGSLDAVSGGDRACDARLQRLHGSTAWRTVAHGALDAQLRFRINAQPPAVGRYYYRVLEPWCGPTMAAAGSPRFTITAT